MVLAGLLLNLAGGDCVDDLERLEGDAAFGAVLRGRGDEAPVAPPVPGAQNCAGAGALGAASHRRLAPRPDRNTKPPATPPAVRRRRKDSRHANPPGAEPPSGTDNGKTSR